MVLGQCLNFADQLQLFATKCQPMLKVMFSGIDPASIQEDPLFEEFFTQLRILLSQIIFDAHIVVQTKVGDTDALANTEYTVQLQSDILEGAQGLYSPLATVINFLMNFRERPDIMGFVLQILKRMFNTFPTFRKNLEEPVSISFWFILKLYKTEMTKVTGTVPNATEALS